MKRIVEWVRLHWERVILIPLITAFLVVFFFPYLARQEPEIVYDINHKIENHVHSFTLIIRNEGSGNIKRNEFVELNLLFRRSIKSVVWHSVFSHKVIEEFCSGYKNDENLNGEKVIYYHLNIYQLAPEAELRLTIYSDDFLAKSPHFSYGSSNNINPRSCITDGTVYKKLCSGNDPLNPFDVKPFYDQCKDARDEICNCPLRAPPQ